MEARRLTRFVRLDQTDLLLALVVILTHAGGQVVVYQLNHTPSAGVSFFPGNGVTVALLLLVSRRRWPVVIIAGYLTELVSHFILHEAVVTAFGLALSDTLGAVIGVMLIRRVVSGPIELDRRRDLLAFLGYSVVLANVIDAVTGPPFARLNGSHGSYLTLTATWWIADALGVLIVGSFILAWATPRTGSLPSPRLRLEADAALAVTAVLTWAVFWRWDISVVYLALIPAGWAGIRYGTRGATANVVVVASLGEWATVNRHGLFAVSSHGNTQHALLLLQLFLAVVSLTGLLAAYYVAQIRNVGEALRASEQAELAAREQAKDTLVAERARLARELHDSVSQALFSMTLHARAAQQRLLGSTDVDLRVIRDVDALHELTRGALAEMRALIFEMRPDALAEEGLVAALTRQGAAIQSRTGVTVTVIGPDQRLPLGEYAEENLYRAALEALHNSVSHAHADTATICVQRDEGYVDVAISDHGIGFDSTATAPGHLGLHTMRERATRIGAELTVESALGSGTTIHLAVPAQRPGG